MNFNYKDKYIKYKKKYVELKKKIGGSAFPVAKTFLPYTKTIKYMGHNLILRMMDRYELGDILNRESMNNHHHNKTAGVSFARQVLGISNNNRLNCNKDCKRNNIIFGVALYIGKLEEVDFEYVDPYLYVTLQVNPVLQLALPMGIQRNFNYQENISRSSFILHTFWASFVKNKFPKVKYCLVSPTGAMTHLFLKYLKFVNGEWIPIAINFLGDMEIFLDDGDEYFNNYKDEYRLKISNQKKSKEQYLKKNKEKLIKRIEKAKNIYNENILYLKEEKDYGDISDEEYKNELQKEENNYLQKIKNLENIEREIKEFQEILNSQDKLKNHVKKSISRYDNFHKIQSRINSNGLLIPNPIDYRESQKSNRNIF